MDGTELKQSAAGTDLHREQGESGMHVYGRFPGQEMKIDSEHGLSLRLQQKEVRKEGRGQQMSAAHVIRSHCNQTFIRGAEDELDSPRWKFLAVTCV